MSDNSRRGGRSYYGSDRSYNGSGRPNFGSGSWGGAPNRDSQNQASVSGQNARVTINNNFNGPSGPGHRNAYRPSRRRRPQQGASGPSSYAGVSRHSGGTHTTRSHNAPSTSHSNGRTTTSEPLKCVNCSGNHHGKFCPHPNTADGRLQYCRVCNTTDHPMFKCPSTSSDYLTPMEYKIFWVDRIGLPILVHNKPLHVILANKLATEQERDSTLNNVILVNPGPLSPFFVQALKAPNHAVTPTRGEPLVDPRHIRNEKEKGKKMPWELKDIDLRSRFRRIATVILDPLTIHPDGSRIIHGTVTEWNEQLQLIDCKPKTPVPVPVLDTQMTDAQPQPAPHPTILEEATEALQDGTLLQSRHNTGASRVESRRSIRRPRRADPSHNEGEPWCDNCDKSGHLYTQCIEPCVHCGTRPGTPSHQTAEGGAGLTGCNFACHCRPRSHHMPHQCKVICRLCPTLQPQPNLEIHTVGQCHWCCHYCGTKITPENNHQDCEVIPYFGKCLECDREYAHWRQDCDSWLSKLCLHQECAMDDDHCVKHCLACGVPLDYMGMEKCPNTESISNSFHQHVCQQWSRKSETVFSGNLPNSTLVCKDHPEPARTIDDIARIRQASMNRINAVIQARPDVTAFDPELIAIMGLPECPLCYSAKYPTADQDDHRNRVIPSL